MSLYDTTIPLYLLGLENLSGVLTKAEEWCDKNGKPHSEILDGHLYEDMKDFCFQIRTATNSARSGVIDDKWYWHANTPGTGDEHDFASLQARIKKTIDDLKAVDKATIKDRPLAVWPSGFEGKGPVFKFTSAVEFLNSFCTPNFFFHQVTAYDICRSKGVPLGKADYLDAASKFVPEQV